MNSYMKHFTRTALFFLSQNVFAKKNIRDKSFDIVRSHKLH